MKNVYLIVKLFFHQTFEMEAVSRFLKLTKGCVIEKIRKTNEFEFLFKDLSPRTNDFVIRRFKSDGFCELKSSFDHSYAYVYSDVPDDLTFGDSLFWRIDKVGACLDDDEYRFKFDEETNSLIVSIDHGWNLFSLTIYDKRPFHIQFTTNSNVFYFPRYPQIRNDTEFTILKYYERSIEKYINPTRTVKSGELLKRIDGTDSIIPPRTAIEALIVQRHKKVFDFYPIQRTFFNEFAILMLNDLVLTLDHDRLEFGNACLIELDEI